MKTLIFTLITLSFAFSHAGRIDNYYRGLASYNPSESFNIELLKKVKDWNETLGEKIGIIGKGKGISKKGISKGKVSSSVFEFEDTKAGLMAFHNKKAEEIISLIKKGADVNAQDEQTGETPLLILTKKVYSQNTKIQSPYRMHVGKVMEVFLSDYDADANISDHQGNTPLHWAVRSLNGRYTQLLIHYNADLNRKNNEGKTPLHILMTEHMGIVFTLFPGSRGYFTGPEGATLRNVRYLLSKGANPNVQDTEGNTPLHLIRSTNAKLNTEIAKNLLESGADPNIRNEKGRTVRESLNLLHNSSLTHLIEAHSR